MTFAGLCWDVEDVMMGRSCWAHIIGPIVLVCRCKAKSLKDLYGQVGDCEPRVGTKQYVGQVRKAGWMGVGRSCQRERYSQTKRQPKRIH